VTQRSGPTGRSRYGSLDDAIDIEIDSTPLGDGLDPAIRARIADDCRKAWSAFLTSAEAGGVEFPFRSHIVVAVR
jgi:hypothetical protein